MPAIFLLTSALILIVQAGPSAAQSYRDGSRYEPWQHQRHAGDGVSRTSRHPEVLPRKPRLCYRPDIGRDSRLIPYPC
ncbi:hypothetical protein [Methylobacterium iners]|uniref:Secreted protein n=1 Tax=Methylobacterium iners TaxID=418707 RepID=A0ABQ4S1X8_9HYPH|nr:hypothetical protein [Methylobacterium iners]GJD96871.1 hypothetical protein OCOJLMKI_4098 [Methylobacterium iners]